MIKQIGTLGVLAIIALSSCAGSGKIKNKQADCSERMQKAIELYQAKKYSAVALRLEDARMQCGGSVTMDTVLYYLGMVNCKTKKFIEARTEFQRLVQDFPGSPYFDEAKFRIGYAIFKQSNTPSRDQKDTKEAIRVFDALIESYPHNTMMDSIVFYRTAAIDKLAEKEFNNALFYEVNHEPEAAIIYYDVFLNQFSETKRADDARLNKLTILMKIGRNSEAQEVYADLQATCKNKEILKKAKNLIPAPVSEKSK